MSSVSGRQRVLWGALAFLAILAAAYSIQRFVATDPEVDRLDRVIAQVAEGATDEGRPLHLEAGQVARDLLQDFPDDAEALDAVARLYQRLRRGEDAVGCWKRSIELDPAHSAAAHAAIASVAFDAGDFEAAADHYRAAAEQDPASATYPVSLGEALISQGNLDEAVGVLEQAVKAHPRSMPAAALLGQAYLQLRQYEKARRHLENSVRTSPDYPAAYHGLATVYTQLGDEEKAREHRKRFQEAHARKERQHRAPLAAKDDLAPVRQTVAGIYADAARVYLVRGDLEAGEKRLLRARELAPGGAAWLLLLAGLYERQGRPDEALAVLAEAGEGAPGEVAAQLHVAFAYSRLGSPDKAEEVFRRVIELAPREGSSHAALAQFYLQAGRKLPEARKLAQRAVDLEPAGEYCFLLAHACLRSGDRLAARRAIEQAVAVDPDNEAFRQLRDQLARQP